MAVGLRLRGSRWVEATDWGDPSTVWFDYLRLNTTVRLRLKYLHLWCCEIATLGSEVREFWRHRDSGGPWEFCLGLARNQVASFSSDF